MATTKTIQLRVITPERQVLAETTNSVVIPMHDGELGVLSGRAPLMCELGIGQLRYESGGHTHRVFIDGGFAQVHADQVTVLTPDAKAQAEVSQEVIDKAAAVEVDPRDTEARQQQQRRLATLRSLKS